MHLHLLVDTEKNHQKPQLLYNYMQSCKYKTNSNHMTVASRHTSSLSAIPSHALRSIDRTPKMNVIMPVNTGLLYKGMRKLIHLPQQVSLHVYHHQASCITKLQTAPHNILIQ